MVALFADKKAVTKDKTVKQECYVKSSLKSVKFQVSKAVKQDGDSAGTERMTAKLNGKCEIYFSVDTMAPAPSNPYLPRSYASHQPLSLLKAIVSSGWRGCRANCTSAGNSPSRTALG